MCGSNLNNRSRDLYNTHLVGPQDEIAVRVIRQSDYSLEKVMTQPLTVLPSIAASGGAADSGNKSEVTLLRQSSDGRLRTLAVNLKRILEGKDSSQAPKKTIHRKVTGNRRTNC